MLLLISSFLPYWSVDCPAYAANLNCSSSVWTSNLFPILPSVYLLGIAAGALILLQHLQGEAAKNRQILGLRLDQWGISFAVVALWTALWSLGAGSDHSWGAYLGLISVLVLAGVAVAGPLVPALQAPLVTDKPAMPQGYQQVPGGYPGAGQPGQPFGGQPQQGGYGFPAPGAAQPGQPFAGQPQQGGYGFPAPGAAQPAAGQPAADYGFGQGAQPVPGAVAGQPQDAAFQPAAAAPAPAQSALAAAEPAPAAQAPAADFAPYWFAVPEARQLAPKDGPAGPPVGELQPGTWYLAVEQRGAALVAQLQDGTQGLLNDTAGIQRG
ncbi:hypothetical protein [Kitasatospora sp. LaBMicrA B282]|uniref:hypothetical protein n=1 Tax=Kitasatospora sp. LaBMicrA B282 TaxID=3420949 RepID=UPI003D0A8452